MRDYGTASERGIAAAGKGERGVVAKINPARNRQQVGGIVRPRLVRTDDHGSGDGAGGNAGGHGDATRADSQRIAVGVEAEAVGGVVDRQALDAHVRAQKRGGGSGGDGAIGNIEIRAGAGDEGLGAAAGGRHPVAGRAAIRGRPCRVRTAESACPVGGGQGGGAGNSHLEVGGIASEAAHREVGVVINQTQRGRGGRSQIAARTGAMDQRVVARRRSSAWDTVDVHRVRGVGDRRVASHIDFCAGRGGADRAADGRARPAGDGQVGRNRQLRVRRRVVVQSRTGSHRHRVGGIARAQARGARDHQGTIADRRVAGVGVRGGEQHRASTGLGEAKSFRLRAIGAGDVAGDNQVSGCGRGHIGDVEGHVVQSKFVAAVGSTKASHRGGRSASHRNRGAIQPVGVTDVVAGAGIHGAAVQIDIAEGDD